ncbi:unnamed protein product [Chondrus crispus]|uniref:Uncharacterized protein n=1 Tax=Chondrus crispus TaxID=2769 RepID=R7QKF4_CHOCR|nr:unnamed protein product [Chondrus crispus]CDF38258.1 unnamed protein product [Chondrus crispus]|eukprot:XP_005718143.1 unnamed protein product [Chondrus crispus]
MFISCIGSLKTCIVADFKSFDADLMQAVRRPGFSSVSLL